MSQLPSFLEPALGSASCSTAPFVSTYSHSQRLGGSKALCLWWPCKAANTRPKTVLLFVPGNPGLVEFYRPFLTHIYGSSSDSLAILGHSLLGHSPSVDPVPLAFSGLQAQVEGIIEIIDTLGDAFDRIVLVGHSVGSWFVYQTLRERADQITGAFLLFPTITHIVRTPNGERLSWVFRAPLPRIVSNLSRLLRFVPKQAISFFSRDWPANQFNILWSFINSPSAVMASLTMAHEEMITIKDLDTSLLENVKHKLYFFFAEEDDWVGANKDAILREMANESHSVRITHGRRGIPHAYCINHGKELGDQCLEWLKDDIFSV